MKRLLCLCILTTSAFFTTVKAQQIIRNSLLNASFVCHHNVTFHETAGPTVRIQNARLEGVRTLVFTDNTVVLDNASIQCVELQFAPTVSTINVSGLVTIDCGKLTLPTSAIPIVIANLGAAELRIVCDKDLPSTRSFQIADATNFRVSIIRK